MLYFEDLMGLLKNAGFTGAAIPKLLCIYVNSKREETLAFRKSGDRGESGGSKKMQVTSNNGKSNMHMTSTKQS